MPLNFAYSKRFSYGMAHNGIQFTKHVCMTNFNYVLFKMIHVLENYWWRYFIFFIKEWDIKGYEVFLFLYGPQSSTFSPTLNNCTADFFSNTFLSSRQIQLIKN